MADNEEYYTIEEACRKMRITRSTIMHLIKKGKLKTYRTGGDTGQHRITQKQIDKCMKGEK